MSVKPTGLYQNACVDYSKKAIPKQPPKHPPDIGVVPESISASSREKLRQSMCLQVEKKSEESISRSEDRLSRKISPSRRIERERDDKIHQSKPPYHQSNSLTRPSSTLTNQAFLKHNEKPWHNSKKESGVSPKIGGHSTSAELLNRTSIRVSEETKSCPIREILGNKSDSECDSSLTDRQLNNILTANDNELLATVNNLDVSLLKGKTPNEVREIVKYLNNSKLAKDKNDSFVKNYASGLFKKRESEKASIVNDKNVTDVHNDWKIKEEEKKTTENVNVNDKNVTDVHNDWKINEEEKKTTENRCNFQDKGVVEKAKSTFNMFVDDVSSDESSLEEGEIDAFSFVNNDQIKKKTDYVVCDNSAKKIAPLFGSNKVPDVKTAQHAFHNKSNPLIGKLEEFNQSNIQNAILMRAKKTENPNLILDPRVSMESKKSENNNNQYLSQKTLGSRSSTSPRIVSSSRPVSSPVTNSSVQKPRFNQLKTVETANEKLPQDPRLKNNASNGWANMRNGHRGVQTKTPSPLETSCSPKIAAPLKPSFGDFLVTGDCDSSKPMKKNEKMVQNKKNEIYVPNRKDDNDAALGYAARLIDNDQYSGTEKRIGLLDLPFPPIVSNDSSSSLPPSTVKLNGKPRPATVRLSFEEAKLKGRVPSLTPQKNIQRLSEQSTPTSTSTQFRAQKTPLTHNRNLLQQRNGSRPEDSSFYARRPQLINQSHHQKPVPLSYKEHREMKKLEETAMLKRRESLNDKKVPEVALNRYGTLDIPKTFGPRIPKITKVDENGKNLNSNQISEKSFDGATGKINLNSEKDIKNMVPNSEKKPRDVTENPINLNTLNKIGNVISRKHEKSKVVHNHHSENSDELKVDRVEISSESKSDKLSNKSNKEKSNVSQSSKSHSKKSKSQQQEHEKKSEVKISKKYEKAEDDIKSRNKSKSNEKSKSKTKEKDLMENKHKKDCKENSVNSKTEKSVKSSSESSTKRSDNQSSRKHDEKKKSSKSQKNSKSVSSSESLPIKEASGCSSALNTNTQEPPTEIVLSESKKIKDGATDLEIHKLTTNKNDEKNSTKIDTTTMTVNVSDKTPVYEKTSTVETPSCSLDVEAELGSCPVTTLVPETTNAPEMKVVKAKDSAEKLEVIRSIIAEHPELLRDLGLLNPEIVKPCADQNSTIVEDNVKTPCVVSTPPNISCAENEVDERSSEDHNTSRAENDLPILAPIRENSPGVSGHAEREPTIVDPSTQDHKTSRAENDLPIKENSPGVSGHAESAVTIIGESNVSILPCNTSRAENDLPILAPIKENSPGISGCAESAATISGESNVSILPCNTSRAENDLPILAPITENSPGISGYAESAATISGESNVSILPCNTSHAENDSPILAPITENSPGISGYAESAATISGESNVSILTCNTSCAENTFIILEPTLGKETPADNTVCADADADDITTVEQEEKTPKTPNKRGRKRKNQPAAAATAAKPKKVKKVCENSEPVFEPQFEPRMTRLKAKINLGIIAASTESPLSSENKKSSPIKKSNNVEPLQVKKKSGKKNTELAALHEQNNSSPLWCDLMKIPPQRTCRKKSNDKKLENINDVYEKPMMISNTKSSVVRANSQQNINGSPGALSILSEDSKTLELTLGDEYSPSPIIKSNDKIGRLVWIVNNVQEPLPLSLTKDLAKLDCFKKPTTVSNGKSDRFVKNRGNSIRKCKICHQAMSSEISNHSLAKHAQSHTKDKRYNCVLHSFSTTEYKKALEHNKMCAEGPGKMVDIYELYNKNCEWTCYKCKQCDYINIIRSTVESHLKSHHSIKYVDENIISFDMFPWCTEVSDEDDIPLALRVPQPIHHSDSENEIAEMENVEPISTCEIETINANCTPEENDHLEINQNDVIFSLGSFKAVRDSEGVIFVSCKIVGCIYREGILSLDNLNKHINDKHPTTSWTYNCEACASHVDPLPNEEMPLITCVEHFKCHFRDGEFMSNIAANIKKERDDNNLIYSNDVLEEDEYVQIISNYDEPKEDVPVQPTIELISINDEPDEYLQPFVQPAEVPRNLVPLAYHSPRSLVDLDLEPPDFTQEFTSSSRVTEKIATHISNMTYLSVDPALFRSQQEKTIISTPVLPNISVRRISKPYYAEDAHKNVREEMDSLRNEMNRKTSGLLDETEHTDDVQILLPSVIKRNPACLPCNKNFTSSIPSDTTFNSKQNCSRPESQVSATPPFLSPVKSDAPSVFYSPDQVDHLPKGEVYAYKIGCSSCSFSTTVRSNMKRHLIQHLNAKITGIPVPSAVPLNKVHEISTKLFDATKNYANSCSMDNALRSGLTEIEKNGLPGFVKDNVRFKCFECHSLCGSEELLINHITTLHNAKQYICPHCAGSNINFITPICDLGFHLKCHSDKLYKCGACSYIHFLKISVEEHFVDKHKSLTLCVFTVREQNAETKKYAYKCNFCNFMSMKSTLKEISDHMQKTHRRNDKFECKNCPFKCKAINQIKVHWRIKHDSQEPRYVAPFEKVILDENGTLTPSKVTPTWPPEPESIPYIRGIPIEIPQPAKSISEVSKKRPGPVCNEVARKQPKTDFLGRKRVCWSCPICKDELNTPELCKEHIMSMHMKMAQFTCSKCPIICDTKYLADQHKACYHPNTNIKPCAIINFDKFKPNDIFWAACFGYKTRTDKFSATNFAGDCTQCTACKFLIPKEYKVSHDDLHSHCKKFVCEFTECSYKTGNVGNFEKHKNVHEWNVPIFKPNNNVGYDFRFKCSACDTVTTSATLVKAHARSKHDFKDSDCFFAPLDDVQYKCAICQLIVIGCENMEVHWVDFHKSYNLAMAFSVFGTIEFNMGPFACSHCSITTPSYDDCKRHINVHHKSGQCDNNPPNLNGCVLIYQGHQVIQKYNLAKLFIQKNTESDSLSDDSMDDQPEWISPY